MNIVLVSNDSEVLIGRLFADDKKMYHGIEKPAYKLLVLDEEDVVKHGAEGVAPRDIMPVDTIPLPGIYCGCPQSDSVP